MKKIFSLLLVLCLGIVLTGCNKKDEKVNYAKLTDEGFLTKVGEWEREDEPSIKIKFNIDGTGKTTTDGLNWIDMNWFYDEDILAMNTKINSKDIITDCIIKLDKEDVEFELVDLNNEIKVKYVKSGSQNIKEKERIKDEKVIGLWYRADFDYDNLEILTTVKIFLKCYHLIIF